MELHNIESHVARRALVRVTFGPAKGMTGQLMGYNDSYDTVRVGWLNEDGTYSGDKHTCHRSSVELVTEDATPAPIVDGHGRVWTWKEGVVYTHCGMAAPAALARTAGLPSDAVAYDPGYSLCDVCRDGRAVREAGR